MAFRFNLSHMFFGGSQTTQRSPMLDMDSAQWARALATPAALIFHAQTQIGDPSGGPLNPLAHESSADGQRRWVRESHAAFDGFMPIDVRYFARPDQMAPRQAKQIGPPINSDAQGLALQAALADSMRRLM